MERKYSMLNSWIDMLILKKMALLTLSGTPIKKWMAHLTLGGIPIKKWMALLTLGRGMIYIVFVLNVYEEIIFPQNRNLHRMN